MYSYLIMMVPSTTINNWQLWIFCCPAACIVALIAVGSVVVVVVGNHMKKYWMAAAGIKPWLASTLLMAQFLLFLILSIQPIEHGIGATI
jgi:hypothetical protein